MRSHTLFAFGALLTTASAVPDQLLPTRDTCYSGVFTIVARGSEEPQGQSVLEAIVGNVTAAIPNSGSNEVVYPALLSFWDSAPTGVTDAQQQMQDYHAKCPDGKIVLMGYSQGSYVLSTALAGGNFSGQTWAPIASDIGDSIAAVVVFGNPARLLGQGTIAEGTNCASVCTVTAPLALKSPYDTAMEVYSDRLESWCAAADPICCKTGNDIAAHLGYWSDNTTDTVVQFVQAQVSSASNASSTTSSMSSSATSSSASSATSSSAPSGTASPVASSTPSSAPPSVPSSTAPTSASGPSATAPTTGSTPVNALASASAQPSSNDGHRSSLSMNLAFGTLSLCSMLVCMQLTA